MTELSSQLVSATSDPVISVDRAGLLIPLNVPAVKFLASDPEPGLHLYVGETIQTADILAARFEQCIEAEIRRGDDPLRHVNCQIMRATAASFVTASGTVLAENSVICLLTGLSDGSKVMLPEMNPHPVLSTDLTGRVLYANPASRFLLQLLDGDIDGVLPEPLMSALNESLEKKHPVEIQTSHADFHYTLTCAPLPSHACVNIYGTDITQRVRAEEMLLRQASEDKLTNLANHSRLLERLGAARKSHDPTHKVFAVLYIDLDRFSRINDTYGHGVGDALLTQVADRLKACSRKTDTVARISGDQFCILLENLDSITQLVDTAEAILNSFQQHFVVDDHDIELSCSLGVSLNTKPKTTDADLIHEADMAMRRAKTAGRGRMSVYDESMMARVARSVSLEQMIKVAVREEQFSMSYQPKINVTNSSVVGFEALIRWKHPLEGMISPAEFIPLAEDTGIIVPVGDLVIRSVCKDIRGWLDAGVEIAPVAVNCSAMQLLREDFTSLLREQLDIFNIDPALFQVEITESSLIEDMETVILRLEELRDIGIKIFLDDFGTGFSSLQYLKRLPIHYLKVDQSFVRDMLENKDDRTITSTIIAMARELGLSVIAEGVENRKQVYSLMAMGCNEIQGFYYSPPIPGPEVAKYLEQQKTAPTSL